MKKIGFIGLGAMGARMATHMVQDGLEVHGFDVNTNAVERFGMEGGKMAASVTQVASDASLLVLMVHNAHQVEDILFGDSAVLSVLQSGATIWLSCTVSPQAAMEFGARLLKHNFYLLDGPVSGGSVGAEAGTLTIMASGRLQAFQAAEAAMQACSRRIFNLGPKVGTASTVKAINQLLTASHIALAAEAMFLGAQADIAPELLIEVINESGGASKQFSKRAVRMAQGDYEKQSTINIFLKDLRIAIETARDMGVKLPVSQSALGMFEEAAHAGWGDDSDTRIIDTYRVLNSVKHD